MGDLKKKYIHGYTQEEQSRLRAQAILLQNKVFQDVNFPKNAKVLEVGAGVGAQSEILLERFPTVTVSSVDRSPEQIETAQKHFKNHKNAHRLTFHQADAAHLPFESQSFDAAFVCWLLEHTSNPVQILKEVKRCLKPGSPIFLNEVFNRIFHIGPVHKAFDQYWTQFNQLQIDMGGFPYVGIGLGNLLSEAGFQDIKISMAQEHWDSRHAEKTKENLLYLQDLLLSGASALLDQGRISKALLEDLKAEIQTAISSKNGVLFFGWMKASAKV